MLFITLVYFQASCELFMFLKRGSSLHSCGKIPIFGLLHCTTLSLDYPSCVKKAKTFCAPSVILAAPLPSYYFRRVSSPTVGYTHKVWSPSDEQFLTFKQNTHTISSLYYTDWKCPTTNWADFLNRTQLTLLLKNMPVLWYCCLQVSWETLIQTALQSTLRYFSFHLS